MTRPRGARAPRGTTFSRSTVTGQTGSAPAKKSTESARDMCMTGCISSAKALTG